MNGSELFSRPATAACRSASAKYPEKTPFHPGSAYPEYRLGATASANYVYDSVRRLFQLLGLDKSNFGTAQWNPLGCVVRPGDRVVLKPNLIWHSHRDDPGQFEQVITHGSVVRAVLDYVLISLEGRGEIWIADGPQLDANWDLILSRTGLAEVSRWCSEKSGVPIRFLDLRDLWEDVRGEVLYGTKALPGDPQGSIEINLAERSRFIGHAGAGRYYGATYDQAETNFHHSNNRHDYRISRTVASADVFINLPKMKTHKKTGVTVCLKNLVGVNTGRNLLPHHTDGDPSTGGDQFPVPSVKNLSERKGVRTLERLTMLNPRLFAPVYRLAKLVARPLWGKTKHTIRSGNWHGNDTCWRMVHDINRCLLYSNGKQFPTASTKRFFAVVDGIVAGDGDGPAAPNRREAGVLVGGFNPVALDCVAARLMGFDPMKLPVLRECFDASDLPLAPFIYQDITIASDVVGWQGRIDEVRPEATFHFEPHFGWRGHMEWSQQPA